MNWKMVLAMTAFVGTERDGCRHADPGVWETLMFLLEAVVVAVHRPRGMHDFPTRARFEIPAERPAFQESLGNPPFARPSKTPKETARRSKGITMMWSSPSDWPSAAAICPSASADRLRDPNLFSWMYIANV